VKLKITFLVVLIIAFSWYFFTKDILSRNKGDYPTYLATKAQTVAAKIIQINAQSKSEYLLPNTIELLKSELKSKDFIDSISNNKIQFMHNLTSIKKLSHESPILYISSFEYNDFIGVVAYADGHTSIFRNENLFEKIINKPE